MSNPEPARLNEELPACRFFLASGQQCRPFVLDDSLRLDEQVVPEVLCRRIWYCGGIAVEVGYQIRLGLYQMVGSIEVLPHCNRD